MDAPRGLCSASARGSPRSSSTLRQQKPGAAAWLSMWTLPAAAAPWGVLFKMHVFLFNPDLLNQQLSGRAQIPVSKPGLRCSDAHSSLRTLLQCRPVIRGVMCARKGPRSPRKAKEPPERLWPHIQRLANEHAALCFQEAQMLKVQGEPCRVLPRRPPHLRGLHLSDHSVSTQSCQCR